MAIYFNHITSRCLTVECLSKMSKQSKQLENIYNKDKNGHMIDSEWKHHDHNLKVLQFIKLK